MLGGNTNSQRNYEFTGKADEVIQGFGFGD